ncbi:hypothetical protein CS536_06705 [Yersinia kristensenii]|nr:hypothetical protein CS536_06705 [Yersinia kristensenii]
MRLIIADVSEKREIYTFLKNFISSNINRIDLSASINLLRITKTGRITAIALHILSRDLKLIIRLIYYLTIIIISANLIHIDPKFGELY